MEYFSVGYAPGQYFNCSAQRCTLSVDSCAAQFRRSKGSGSACAGCQIGAGHAGEAIPAISKRLCCRCGETDKRIIHKQICVSCYNREREFLLGQNAKGQRPIHARPVRATDIFVSGLGRTHLDRVADIAEATLVVLQRNPQAMARPMFAPVPIPQMSLFGWAV